MVQTDLTHHDRVPFLKTDQGRYKFYENFVVQTALTSPCHSELRSECNFYVQPTSSHNLQGFRLRPCAGSHRISKILIINSNICDNGSIHSNIVRTGNSRVKSKVITATQQSTIAENKKGLKSQSCLKRWKFGKPCNVWPKCTNTSGFAFVIKKNTSQNCPEISLQEKQQNTSHKSKNTTCFALKIAKEGQDTSKVFSDKCHIVTPKSTNSSCEHIKDDSCASKISKKVTFDLTNTKSKSNDNFIPNKSHLRKCKNSVRAFKWNIALAVNKAIFSKLGHTPEGQAGIHRNQNESWDLKVNYGCSDFRERLMLEVQSDKTRNMLGFPLKDSLESYNMYHCIPSYQAY